MPGGCELPRRGCEAIFVSEWPLVYGRANRVDFGSVENFLAFPVEQFGIYLTVLARGDLGTSLNTGQPVLVDLMQRLPASVELTLFALLLAVLVGMPLGLLATMRPGSLVAHVPRSLTTLSAAFPGFSPSSE